MTNPLRILDSKDAATQAILRDAPQLADYLDEGSLQHFSALCAQLDACGIQYRVNPNLVRGLDYYNKTVFEWVTTALGSQGTVCAGGRYDGLVTQLGGQATPAVGFAIGLERLVLLLDAVQPVSESSEADVMVLALGEGTTRQAIALAEQLRDALPRLRIVYNCGGGSFKSQFRKADKSGAQIALIMGESEAAQNTVGIKWLRAEREQISCAVADAAEHIRQAWLQG